MCNRIVRWALPCALACAVLACSDDAPSRGAAPDMDATEDMGGAEEMGGANDAGEDADTAGPADSGGEEDASTLPDTNPDAADEDVPAMDAAADVPDAMGDADSEDTGGPDAPQEYTLADFFTPATQEEIQAVMAQWDERDVGAYGFRVEGSGQVGGIPVDVISHTVGGDRHYAAVRYPAQYDPEASYPVLVVNHGGGSGVGLGGLASIGDVEGSCYDDFFILLPSFRGEPLRARGIVGEDLLSEGEQSVLDGDVDDVMAMLTAVLENYPAANPGRIGSTGASRGGGVTYLHAVRDQRVQIAVVFYGASDHTHPSLMPGIERAIAQSMAPGNPVERTAFNDAIGPWLEGILPFREARLMNVRRSAVYFLDRMPDLEVHHGERDRVVPYVQGTRVADEMARLGRQPPEFSFFGYPEGEHNQGSMAGALERRAARFCPLAR